MSDEWYGVLQREFAAKKGSFLLQLRSDLVWDKTAFSRLTAAMLDCCKAYDMSHQSPDAWVADYHQRSVPRWLAEGFWYASTFVKGHTSHPAWREKIVREPDYYDQAYERLFWLAEWFFTGQHSFRNPDVEFAPM